MLRLGSSLTLTVLLQQGQIKLCDYISPIPPPYLPYISQGQIKLCDFGSSRPLPLA